MGRDIIQMTPQGVWSRPCTPRALVKRTARGGFECNLAAKGRGLLYESLP
ncbi:MAG: hypothetical protein JW932_01150 [Deltaproteobacteria bacterium]|nr:hypothetical protein [Deltaproteobacteria bacterium]